jgi:oxygen-independent coproporphyrinogen-3 oxidase
MNNINSQYIERAIEEAEASYSEVLGLYKNSFLDTNPMNIEFITSFVSFSAIREYDGNARFISSISDKTGLYIHFPFCRRFCNYCFYVKTEANNTELIKLYIKALKKEIRFYAKQIQRSMIKYIYFGGGTPTAINKLFLKEVVDELNTQFTISDDVQFTVEGCPDSLDEKMISFLSELGVNRISVGIQSFDEEVLLEMKREHSISQLNKLIENLHKYFPSRFNIDLIFGHHASNKNKLCIDLEKVRLNAIPSVTFYQIWLCHATPAKLKSGHITFEDLLFQRMIINAYMKNLNYSNGVMDMYFANDDTYCKFQKHKWKNNDFISVGAGSNGYINGVLYRNYGTMGDDDLLSIKGYISMVEKYNHSIRFYCELNSSEKHKKSICLGLKLNEYLEYTNTVFQQQIEHLSAAKLIDKKGNSIKLSKEGFYMADIIVKYLRDSKSSRLLHSQRSSLSIREGIKGTKSQ